jgi:hypothetical protein
MKQNTIDYYVKELREAEDRLSDLNQIGIKALSSYDINIAHSGHAKLALWTAKRLVSNQIKYFKRKILELEKEPTQIALF